MDCERQKREANRYFREFSYPANVLEGIELYFSKDVMQRAPSHQYPSQLSESIYENSAQM